MSHKTLVTLLSWEDRYILGLQKNLEKYLPNSVVIFAYENPLTETWKKDNLNRTKKLLGKRFHVIKLNPNTPHENWFIFKRAFANLNTNTECIIDITTMTRETIWLSLYNCKINSYKTNYVYYKPEHYSNDWISRDPGKPRLLYKMSGVAKLGSPTLLLITGGYDTERLDSLIHHFEPKSIMLFFQEGNAYENLKKNKNSEEKLKSKYNIQHIYYYNAYSINSSVQLVVQKLNEIDVYTGKKMLEEYNIILNSLGPKPSAISLFRIWNKFPQLSLSYIPAKEYNKDYSTGIGVSYMGLVSF